MPLFDLFWSMLWIFLFFVWIWLLISVFIDIFRTDLSGLTKALWVVFVIVLPFLGVLVYIIVHGDDMQDRAMQRAAGQQTAQREYIQDMAGSGSAADELAKLKGLHDQGVLTDDEFAAQKQKVLAT
ncbi:MAG: SHOCT domain-containing protein [Acidimicrobiia bacterium]|nr:MAG: SHOCT domain-containing protein [Acidimicrobiia bacterium]